MTMIHRDTYMKKNFLFNNTDSEKALLKRMLTDNILINLRTYDANSLVLYANDHLNNFVHLYIQNKKNLVFLFNSGNEIKRISVQYQGRDSLRGTSGDQSGPVDPVVLPVSTDPARALRF